MKQATMYTIALMLLSAVFLSACTQQGPPIVGSTQSFSAQYAAWEGVGSIGAMPGQDFVAVSMSNTTVDRVVYIYGVNGSGVSFYENVTLNRTKVNLTSNKLLYVTRIVLNESVTGTVSIMHNHTRQVISTISDGTNATLADLYPGGISNYGALPGLNVVPGKCVNTSAISVKTYTALSIWESGTNGNSTVTAYTSIDGSLWNTLIALQTINNATSSALTDTTPLYVKFQVCTNGINQTRLQAAIVGK